MRKLKKGCAIVLALALSMSLMTGCGDKGKSDDKKDTGTKTEATATDAADDNSETIGQLVDYYAQNVELGTYKGVEYTKTDVEVTDDEVQEQVDQVRLRTTCSSRKMDVNTSSSVTAQTVLTQLWLLHHRWDLKYSIRQTM